MSQLRLLLRRKYTRLDSRSDERKRNKTCPKLFMTLGLRISQGWGRKPVSEYYLWDGGPRILGLNQALVLKQNQVYYQRKFWSSNFQLYWKLPLGLAASMFDSRDVLQHRCETWEILAGRNCAKCCVIFHSFAASRARKVIAKMYIGILRSSVWSTCHFWRRSRRKASFLSFKASFLKEVSRQCFFLSFKVSFLK